MLLYLQTEREARSKRKEREPVKEFKVEVFGTAREVYVVEAETADEALDAIYDGECEPDISEVIGYNTDNLLSVTDIED